VAIEYRLTLAGDIPLEQVAAIAAPNATETSSPAGNRLLSADLNEERGYSVSITSGTHGYYDAEDDEGATWEWEPDRYVDINFRISKNDPTDMGTPNMVSAVAQVLTGRPEDVALVLNGNYLLLTRVNGKLRKHNLATWYDEDYEDILPA
jgi:hypothetical protein